MLSVIKLSVVVLSVIKLSVVVLSVNMLSVLFNRLAPCVVNLFSLLIIPPAF
jgi:hypothetical protein